MSASIWNPPHARGPALTRLVTRSTWVLCLMFCCLLLAIPLTAAVEGHGSITDRSVAWPTTDQWQRVLTLRDYNTRVVVLGTTLLGLAAGTIGSFTLLRKRALMGDALSHATLPGICLAFMWSAGTATAGKSLAILLTGATISGVLGMGCILFIRNFSRLKEDAALGVVLSVFFGAGVALLGVIQNMETGHAAGLESFIYGKTASMVSADAWLIGTTGAVVTLLCTLFFKEFKLLCFDEHYARTRGLPTLFLDGVMMGLVVAVTVIGLQAVGLILVIALLIVPAAAARFWTERMIGMVFGSALLGGVSALIGATMSAIFPRLPSGAMIVIVAAGLFLLSLIFGPARGVLMRALRQQAINRKVDREHLLRAIYERVDADSDDMTVDSGAVHSNVALAPVEFDQLLRMRSWSAGRLRRRLCRVEREGLLLQLPGNMIRLTSAGVEQARRVVREHRLWEMYLITHADIAPSRVDRDADMIEHVLDPRMIAELETLVAAERSQTVPHSPHPISREAPVSAALPRPRPAS